MSEAMDRIDRLAGDQRSGSFDLGYFDAVDDVDHGQPYNDGEAAGTCEEYRRGYKIGRSDAP